MAEDFRAKVTAELDTAEAESKLNAFLNEKRKLKIDVEVNQDSAKKMASSIEKGIKDTKIDTSGISKQLAGSFNITDKNVISKLQSQMDKMISSLGKTWNGKDFDFGKASGFYSGMDSMVNTVMKNAKIVEGATGSYDAFFNYFKDKKIYVSDELKKAMGEDTYKELLQNNIGKIVRDASKGISIDSLWGEMSSLFPEHFSDNITNQVDQIVHAFDVLHQARADVGQVTTAQNMTAEQLTGISDSAAEQVVAIAAKLKESLQSNIMGASEAAKTTIDLDVNVNTDKISSDIRSAVENAGNQAEGALKVNMEVNEEQLVSKIREALSSLATGEEPVKVNLQVNKESLQEDLNLALNEMDLPVHFKIDAEEIESQIRAAVESIQDMEIDLRVNTRDIQNDVDTAVNGATETPEIHVPEVDSSGLAQMQQALNGVNAAGIRGQSVFQSLGGSFREAFSAYSLANMMQDGLYKIVDAGKKAVSTVKEFDDLKTNLAMVTGKDKAYTEDLMQSYNELGQEIGSITSDVAESANTWLRQGRSMADTNQLIKDSMVLSKDAQMSSEDAAQVLTSTLNGFKLGADQASRINDILTSIDLKSASDAGGIGTSLQKVASQANNVGMSLEKTAAIIATIKDVTQGSDETIGTSLKSILSRMNNIKAGKFVDDNGEALNDVEKVLNKIGITMRDNNDQFLDSETIIDSVADKWDTLNKNTQKAVSTALGGTHQVNSVIAMLDNYDKVKMLTETAYNSEGTAEKKFQDNYLNSLEAKTNALKASLENLSTSLVSDNMYSGFLDGAKAMADFAANTDILQASLAGLASAGGVYAFQQLINLFREFSNMGQAMDISRMTEISTDSFEQLLGLTQGLSESQTRMVLSSTALTEAQRAAVLVNQGMSEAEAQAAVAAMGLTTANEAAAASTFTLSGAMEGMLATLMANPLILVAAGVTAAVTAYSAYKRSIEEAVSSAKSAGNTWEENTTSIQDNISRIQELRTALASGTLTEQEAADAKSELLSIQESLSDSYGNQVSGLDLINGSLTEQIALLDQVNEKQSQSFLNENKKGIDKAQKEMEKNRHTYLGRFYDNGSEESEAIKKSIKKLQETYGEDVFKLDSADGITMDIQFNADASTAKDALNDFMTEVSGIEDQFGETDVTDQLANNAASGLTKAKDVLSKYQDIYKQAQEAELISDDKLYKSGDMEQKASKWISDYAKAVEDYNNAISDGDNSKITEASQKFSELDSTVNDLVKNTGMSAYADQVKEIRDELNDTAIANDKFTKAVNGTDTSKFGKSVSDNAKALKEWNLSDTDFRYAFETDGIQKGEDQINTLVQAALDAGVISDTSASSVANLASMLAELGVISSSTGSSLDEAANSIGDISERIDKASAVLTGIQKAESVLDAQSTGKSISLDDFNSDELADYTSALEYNNGALQLNAEKVRELQKAKAEEQIQTNNSQKAEKQNQYMQNIAQIEQLQDQLRGLTDAKGEEAQAIQSSIDALLSDNDAIVNQCNQLDLLSASLREATGAYQNWLDKQNASESGDMFDDAMGAMEKIDNVTKNSDSEDYGRVGTNSYKAAVDFIVPDTVDSQDAEAVSSYMSSIEHYFNHDEDGNRIGLDVQEFCAKATKAGLMELDEASGEYKVAGQKTMEDFAEGLNLSMPMVQAMFGEMEEFGGEFDWADEATKTLGDMAVAAGEAKGRIEEMSGDTDMNIQIDVSDIENTEDKVKTLDNTISQMQNYKTTLDVDSSQVDDANAVIQYCVTQKQMLEAPAVMSVDTSQVDGELGNALSLLQQFQEAQNSVELQASVGADTSEAQGKVDSLVGEIQGLSPEIKATLGIDTTSADTLSASLQALSPEIMVKAGVDPSAVDAYAAEEKQSSGKVTWDNETGAVDAFAAQVHRSSGLVSWGNETSRVKTHFTATGTVNWTNTTPPTKGAGGANGTAHASGTAHAAGSAQYNHLSGHAQASGNWATKTGGTTLVGELGREIVVNPATGTWNTVGDNGAEFVNIPAGSIVFNHLQTEALLDRGFINSRGLAQASGSAMVRGGIPVKQASIASKHTTYSGSKSPSNTDKAVAQAAKDSSSAAKSVTDAAEKVESWEDPWKNAVDWFERFTTKYNNSIDLNEAKAENYSSYENKNKYLDKEIADLSKLKGGYQQAQGYYKYQAEAYADMIGLSQDLRKKVQDGEINIDLLDEDTKSKVEAYQKWYDKIHECESELEKLKKKEKEVDQQKLDNITDRFDDLKKVYSTSNSVIESRLKYREENGESQAPGSKYYKDVNSQRKAQEAQAALLEKEMVAYRAQMEKIRKKYGEGHELYKKALAGYNDLRDELYSCKQSAKELSNTMYELKEKAAEYKTAMYQGRSDNLSSFRDYKEATNYKGSKYGKLTVNDYAQAAKTNDQTILALQNQKKIAMAKLKTLSYGSPEYNDKLDEINGYTQKILDLGKANAEFKKSAVEIRFKPFDDTIDSLDELIDDCDTLKDMLDSDTFFSDAGELTKQGAANIALINKGLNAEQQKIADYRAQLKNAQQEYNAGNLTKEQLKEYQKQYKDGIKESSQAIYSYNQEMLKMYEDQVSKENDLLKENVDIRQKAKDAKEDYYQFNKTIKSKNKDINAIKAQIAALEGTTNAAAKAKLEQLKADLAEKEEDLEDTKHDHEIDLISKGYDNLTDQADKALDSTLNAVKSNSQMQTAVIDEMLKTTKRKYKDAYTEINQIIANTGLKVSDQFKNNIKDSSLKNEQTDKKKADKAVTGIKDTKVSGSTGTGNTSADKVIRNAATDAQDKTLKKLSLSPKSVVVNVGKTATVKVSFSPSTAVNKNFNCTASVKGIVKITQAADSITLKGLKTGKTVIKVQGAGGYCKAVSLNVSVLKDATKNSKIVNSTAKSKKYTLTTEEKNRVLNMSTGQNANTVKANTKKEAELKKWYGALPTYTGGDAEIEKIKDPLVKHFAKKGKKASNANIIKAASILGYRDAKNVSKWDTKKKNAMVKKLQTFGFSKGGVIRNLIPATMGTLLGDAIMKNGDTGFIGAKPGETVLTQDFTKLLKPTTATMQEFTEVMQKAGTPSVKETPVRQEVTMNNDYQFVINGVDVNDMSELKKVIRGELDKHDKELAKEFKKFR
ncbi:phage tail tape measure protein [Blautia massiliensis (ex Durand et al. 2017)]|uniref:phage tail tape measure protein n=1 Tax=Blautia massiliensis (ex Durand et al. 2017) TaxID=1737424 RepID=UPI00156F9345|nr:phage tail tape measure protein [Blautia massiliensis (ex Durand et al. 2017)]NSG60813.1 phage tail tape measure protein [Blautia massiliensis (ex Durand et al. 2017)]NSK94596.1 phage tail tape measure protein [Blautia massiliensis (ex Durand et al. 2017)]